MRRLDTEDIEFRPSTGADAAAFRACLDAVARERRYLALVEAPPIEQVRGFLAAALARGAVQFLALSDGEVVGWCDVTPRDWEGYRHCGTLGMGVLPAYRGRGLGRELLRRTLEAARERGIERVELEVHASNEAAIGLYLRHGFEREGVKRRGRILDGRAEDILCMAWLAPEGGAG
jgi:RimJ/RimL family protein N-acetyltransferase